MLIRPRRGYLMHDRRSWGKQREEPHRRARRGEAAVSVRGRPAAHTDLGPPAWGARPARPPHGPAPGAGDWHCADDGGAAGGPESLDPLSFYYDDERDYLSYRS